MQHSKMAPDLLRRSLLCLVVVLLLSLPIFVYNLAYKPGFLLLRDPSYTALNEEDNTDEGRLKRVLRAAATADNTVILAPVNAAWSAPNSLLDAFLEGFRQGDRTERLLYHLVVVALDDKAYENCKKKHPLCYALKTAGVDFSTEKVFMSADYLKIVWRKIDFLRLVLELGYNFIFTDADIMWFRDPAPFFYTNGDIQISCDRFNGNWEDRWNQVNTGFHYVRSNNKTIEFYKYWYSSRETYPGRHDQDVFDIVKADNHTLELQLDMKFLPTSIFGGLCQRSENMDKVCTMHMNCCIGLRRKVSDMRVMMEDWRIYRDQPPNFHGRLKPSWRVPYNCSLDPL